MCYIYRDIMVSKGFAADTRSLGLLPYLSIIPYVVIQSCLKSSLINVKFRFVQLESSGGIFRHSDEFWLRPHNERWLEILTQLSLVSATAQVYLLNHKTSSVSLSYRLVDLSALHCNGEIGLSLLMLFDNGYVSGCWFVRLCLVV